MLISLVLSAALSAQTPAQTPAPDGPRPFPRIRLADHLPPLTDRSRSFEEARAYVRSNGEEALPITPPQVEITAGEDLSRAAVSVAFNWVWLTDGEGRRPVWFARLRAAGREGAVERFADSRACPGVADSLRSLDALPPIDPRVNGLPDAAGRPVLDDLGIVYLHDNSYSIRLAGRSGDRAHNDRLQVDGGSDSAFAPVIAEALIRLRPCWGETPPPTR